MANENKWNIFIENKVNKYLNKYKQKKIRIKKLEKNLWNL